MMKKTSFRSIIKYLVVLLFFSLFTSTLPNEARASEPFLAEIRMTGFNFAPRGWAFCDGQILPINQNQSLYSLLGTTYGGDGRTSFALPDLRGRFPIHPGANGISLGQKSGEESVSLSTANIQAHSHTVTVNASSAPGDSDLPAGNTWATTGGGQPDYSSTGQLEAPMAAGNVVIGDSNIGTTPAQAHDNMPPFTAVRYIIALQGLFPSRN